MNGVLDVNDLDDFDMNAIPDGTDDINFDGIPDGTDYNKDAILDNRFFFDDSSAWVPDGDSFDDFEDRQLGIPRGRTPMPGNCSADGTATGPLDLTVTGPNNEHVHHDRADEVLRARRDAGHGVEPRAAPEPRLLPQRHASRCRCRSASSSTPARARSRTC